MTNIIITADDYGAIDGIDDGIIDSINNGPVRSVAAFANSPTAVQRLTKLKENTPDDVEIGCHFTLTSGKPVLPIEEVPSVYDEENETYFRNFGDFTYQMDAGEVERELRAQMDIFSEAGIKIAHLSAHHNSLDYFEKFHRIFIKLAHEYYPDEIIATRSPHVTPGMKGGIFREIVKVKIEDENDDQALDLFSEFGNQILSDDKVQKLLAEYNMPGTRMPLEINSSHYGFPDAKKKTLAAIERKYLKRRKKLLKVIEKHDDASKPYEFVVHLIADDYDQFDAFVNQLDTQDYGPGIDPNYFDGRMIEVKSIKGISEEELANVGSQRVSWKNSL